MDKQTALEVEAAVLRRLLDHLRHRSDVQNIDLMGFSGFCRNCLSDWYREAAEERGIHINKGEAREIIYAMPYGEFKDRHHTPASEQQLQRMAESIAKNKGGKH